MNSICRHLEEKGISQAAFAELIGVSQPTVSAWVKGDKRPEKQNLRRVAEALNMPVVDLLAELHLKDCA